MDATNGSNCYERDFVNKTCYEFSKHHYDVVFWAKTSVAMLAVVACCLAVVIIVLHKAYKEFVHRLALYMSTIAFIISIILLVRVIPTEERCGYLSVKEKYGKLCIAMGFLLEYSALVSLLLLLWITFHLFMLAVFKQHCFKSLRNEVACVVTATAAPLPFSIIPLIDFNHNGIMYGLAVPWCWIKTTDVNCNSYDEGVLEQIVLFYGPLAMLILFNFIVMLAVIVVVCKGTRGGHEIQLQNKHKKALKETLPLLLYPIFFNVIFCLAFIPRVYYNITKDASLGLWIMHTTALPCLALFIPLAFLLHPYTLKKLNCFHLKIAANKWRHHSQRSNTHFVVSRHNTCDTTDQRRLIITGGPRQPATYSSFLDVP